MGLYAIYRLEINLRCINEYDECDEHAKQQPKCHLNMISRQIECYKRGMRASAILAYQNQMLKASKYFMDGDQFRLNAI